MNIALVDMDGTLCDYEGALKKEIAKLLNYGSLPLDKDWAILYEDLINTIKKVPGFWRGLSRIELGFKIVDMLKANGFELHVLTKGPYKTTSAWTEKVEWCRDNLPGVPVTITEDKSLMYGKILVDDWPSYCEKWLKWRPRGLVIMPAYDYNKGFELKYPGQVIRTAGLDGNDLDYVEAAIKKVAARYSGQKLDI